MEIQMQLYGLMNTSLVVQYVKPIGYEGTNILWVYLMINITGYDYWNWQWTSPDPMLAHYHYYDNRYYKTISALGIKV